MKKEIIYLLVLIISFQVVQAIDLYNITLDTSQLPYNETINLNITGTTNQTVWFMTSSGFVTIPQRIHTFIGNLTNFTLKIKISLDEKNYEMGDYWSNLNVIMNNSEINYLLHVKIVDSPKLKVIPETQTFTYCQTDLPINSSLEIKVYRKRYNTINVSIDKTTFITTTNQIDIGSNGFVNDKINYFLPRNTKIAKYNTTVIFNFRNDTDSSIVFFNIINCSAQINDEIKSKLGVCYYTKTWLEYQNCVNNLATFNKTKIVNVTKLVNVTRIQYQNVTKTVTISLPTSTTLPQVISNNQYTTNVINNNTEDINNLHETGTQLNNVINMYDQQKQAIKKEKEKFFKNVFIGLGIIAFIGLLIGMNIYARNYSYM